MLSHVTKQFAVKDAKLAKMLTDPAGGSATYGASIDVPGIKSVGVGGDVNTAQLRGDNTLLDTDTVLGNVTVTVANAKISLDVWNVILGMSVTDTGTTPNQVATASLLGTSAPSYFKLEAQSASADPVAGDVHYSWVKLKLSNFPDMGLAEEDYQTTGFEAIAVPRISDGKWMDVTVNETAVAIP